MPTADITAVERWWAGRKSAFAHPTCYFLSVTIAAIKAAMDLINTRNGSEHNASGRYARTKQRFNDEQRIIAGLLNGNLPPEEMGKLAQSSQYKRLTGSLQEIEVYCKKYPSMCNKDYLAKAGKRFSAPGADIAGEKTLPPMPFDQKRLQNIGLISGKTPRMPDPEEKEREFKAWMASQTRKPLPMM